MYEGVVSRDSITIDFTYADLNDINVCSVDIGNSYLQAPSSQNYFIVFGKVFDLENVCKKALIRI